MNPVAWRGIKIVVGVILVGLGLFFVLHHGLPLLGIVLALPGGYLIWDGARKPRVRTAVKASPK